MTRWVWVCLAQELSMLARTVVPISPLPTGLVLLVRGGFSAIVFLQSSSPHELLLPATGLHCLTEIGHVDERLLEIRHEQPGE